MIWRSHQQLSYRQNAPFRHKENLLPLDSEVSYLPYFAEPHSHPELPDEETRTAAPPSYATKATAMRQLYMTQQAEDNYYKQEEIKYSVVKAEAQSIISVEA
jgi:hypothetical protein